MRKYFSSAALLALSLCFAVSFASAQICETNLTNEGKLKSKGDVEVSYVKEADETRVHFKTYASELPVEHNLRADNLALHAGFKYAGQTPPATTPPITLSLSTQTETGFIFPDEKSRRVNIKVNGETIFSGVFELKTSFHGAAPRISERGIHSSVQASFELLTLNIPFEVLEKMVNGSEVALEVGEKRIKLNKNYRKRFCQILSYAEAG